jgi:hypothetical protein
VDVVSTRDPVEKIALLGSKADLLAPGLDVQELALVQVRTQERVEHGSCAGAEIIRIAGDDFPCLVVRGYARDRPMSGIEVELQ